MRCLIIGCGQPVESELARINRADFDVVIGVNKAAIRYGPVDYHVSLHPNMYLKHKQATFVSFTQIPGVDIVLDYLWPHAGGNSGSSGLFAVKFALERLHADQVVLAGVGMDTAPHVYNNQPWKQAERFRHTWETVASRLTGKVTSLGGWTAQLLGQPETVADPGR